MALETGTFISDLVATNPVGSDPLAFADDHLRLVKGTLKNTFPNIAGAVTKTHTQINTAVDQAGAALPRAGGTMTGAITLAGDASSDLHAVPRQQVVSLLQAMYPVGSIYINAGVTTNPATLLGFGTWVAFGAGRVMVGLDGSNTAYDTLQETGGAYGHNHTMATAGAHSHTVSRDGWGTEGGFLGAAATGRLIVGSGQGESVEQLESLRSSGNSVSTNSVGTHSHDLNAVDTVDPYIVVAMWRRTA